MHIVNKRRKKIVRLVKSDLPTKPFKWTMFGLGRLDRPRPGNNSQKRMSNRLKKKYRLPPFEERITHIEFSFDQYPQHFGDVDGPVDQIYKILDKHGLESCVSWTEDPEQIKQIKQYTLTVVNSNNPHQLLEQSLIEQIANQINDIVFKGKVEKITCNVDRSLDW